MEQTALFSKELSLFSAINWRLVSLFLNDNPDVCDGII